MKPLSEKIAAHKTPAVLLPALAVMGLVRLFSPAKGVTGPMGLRRGGPAYVELGPAQLFT